MALTISQKTNVHGFPKPRELIELTGTHALEAQDRVLLNSLYQHAHDSGSLTSPGMHWTVPLATVRPGTHESNDRIRESLSRLLGVQVSVTFHDEAGEQKVLQTVLFEYFETSKSGGGAGNLLEFGIPEKLRRILAQSGRWGRIQAEIVCAMTSKYSITLYEMLRLRINMDKPFDTFTIDRFRELLGVPPGTYTDGRDFRKYVIEPAVLEINGLSELNCRIELIRAHSRAPVTKIMVGWEKKNPDQHRAAITELNRSKLGRKARLRGEVETVA
jgi:hypothetical protein